MKKLSVYLDSGFIIEVPKDATEEQRIEAARSKLRDLVSNGFLNEADFQIEDDLEDEDDDNNAEGEDRESYTDTQDRDTYAATKETP